jgi:TetR/AcrR family transcriptional repressor of nem operon
MKNAGLTVGGFYGHFRNKEALLEETLRFSLRRAYQRLFAGIREKSQRDWLRQIVRRYLSQTNLKDLRNACPLPLLTPEMARSRPKIKRAFADELSNLLDGVLGNVPGTDEPRKKARILAILSCCVGGVAVARALGDSPLAEDIVHEIESILSASHGK